MTQETAAAARVPPANVDTTGPGMHARWRACLGTRGEHACRACGERFARPGYLTLHAGRRHPDALDADQQAAYRAVQQAEREWVAHMARHVKSGLLVVPLFLVWAATLVLLVEMDTSPGWILMTTPGYLLFGGLLYAMGYAYLAGGRERYYGRG